MGPKEGKPFSAYFSREEIVERLISLRVKAAMRGQEKAFFGSFASKAQAKAPHGRNAPTSNSPRQLHKWTIFDLMPPRRKWRRPLLKDRKRLSKQSLLRASLKGALNPFLTRDSTSIITEQWALRLTRFIAEVQYRALTLDCVDEICPKVVAGKKTDKRGRLTGFRPICSYSLLDSVIYGLCAGYLRDAFDPDFLDDSYAFRAPSDRDTKTHHDAALALMMYRDSESGPIWVAECDIKGFFDSVHHEIAGSSFDSACNRAMLRGVHIDPQARVLFNRYLSSYSFVRIAEPVLLKQKLPKRGAIKPKWPEDDLRELWGKEVRDEPIGIPQGGAISGLIANLVLHQADVAVRTVLCGSSKPGHYARYCDDMVLAHPDYATCTEAFSAYQRELQRVRLPAHKVPKGGEDGVFGDAKGDKEHWGGKSKGPYCWSRDWVRWVGFVGYQVRYDGIVRIRKESLAKELRKQRDVVDRTLGALGLMDVAPGGSTNNPLGKHSRNQIRARVLGRLTSMSVGRVGLSSAAPPASNPLPDLGTMCWTSGFRALRDRKLVGSQLRKLDRGRARQVARLWRRLQVVADSPTVRPRNRHERPPRFWGRPFSYEGQFVP